MGAPGNVRARGLNPAQPSDQKYAAGYVKVPYCMCFLDPMMRKTLAAENHPYVDRQFLLLLFFFGAFVGFLQILSGFIESAKSIVVGLQCLTILTDCAFALAGDIEDLS